MKFGFKPEAFFKVLVFALFFMEASISAFAYTERNYLQKAADFDTVKKSLVMGQRWLKLPQYTDREGWEKILGDSKLEFVKEGEKNLSYQWKLIKATDYLEFSRSGNRGILEGPVAANRKVLFTLMVAELAEGRGRFIDQIINGVFLFCEMTTWSPPAHLYIQKVRSPFPDHSEDIIDISGAETAAVLAWAYYFFHAEFDKHNKLISKRLYGELERRILNNYIKDVGWWWLAENYKPGMLVNNWNPWCNSNVLLCYMLLDGDKDRFAKAVYKSMRSVDKYLNYVNEDGACDEGPGYWGVAPAQLMEYLVLLNSATGGKVDIFGNRQVRNMGEYIAYAYIGNGWSVNFADAHANSLGGTPMKVFEYGALTGSRVMMSFSKLMARDFPRLKNRKSGFLDFLRSLNYSKKFDSYSEEFNFPKYKWYPQTEFCHMNCGNFFLAAKGGFNNESHNHNDVGSFILYYKKNPLIIDVGVGTYTRQTFSPQRYSIWTMQSDYHNLPKINGVSQKDGAKYKAKNTRFDETTLTFSTDISGAYPKEANVAAWERSYSLGAERVIIKDEYLLKEASEGTTINFMLPKKPDISRDGIAVLKSDGGDVKMKYDKSQFSASVETVKISDIAISRVWGKELYRLSFSRKNKSLDGADTFEIVAKN